MVSKVLYRAIDLPSHCCTPLVLKMLHELFKAAESTNSKQVQARPAGMF
jgi:hypothetical protein